RDPSTRPSVPPVIRSSGQAPASPAKPRKQAPPSTTLNLDLGQFTPLSDSDVKKKARGLGSLWGNPWFGRRDLIPPVEDPRTNLIDRGMVGHGLITPEDLVEVHSIGRQMDELRPDLAQVQAAAIQAVQDDREALARRKQLKK